MAATYLGYRWTPLPWESFTAGLGALSAYLLWVVRGPAFSVMWLLCIFGVVQGVEVAVCHASMNFWPIGPTLDLCDSYLGFPLTAVSLLAFALVTRLVARRV